MSTFTLADAFDATEPRLRVNLNAPLPLGYDEAIRRAAELRGNGLSYPAIANIMAEYHGFRCCSDWWRGQLRTHGAKARPHGAPFGGRRS